MTDIPADVPTHLTSEEEKKWRDMNQNRKSMHNGFEVLQRLWCRDATFSGAICEQEEWRGVPFSNPEYVIKPRKRGENAVLKRVLYR